MTDLDYPIRDIRGIGGVEIAALATAGIATTAALLDACATPSARATLSMRTGLDGSMLLDLANRADLMRVRGIGTKWGDLLEIAGVDTVKELALRNPDNLHAKLVEVNAAKELVDALPGAGQCADWVEQAKALEPKLEY